VAGGFFEPSFLLHCASGMRGLGRLRKKLDPENIIAPFQETRS
jgi:hypothetical protein